MSLNNYSCDDCDYQFTGQRKRKLCPACKSHNISIATVKPQKKKERGHLCRKAEVKIKTKVIDPGGFDEDRDFTKKVKFSVSQRREQYEDEEITCSRCHQTFYVNPIHIMSSDWKCDTCLIDK